jgi:hypothetical protein
VLDQVFDSTGQTVGDLGKDFRASTPPGRQMRRQLRQIFIDHLLGGRV